MIKIVKHPIALCLLLGMAGTVQARDAGQGQDQNQADADAQVVQVGVGQQRIVRTDQRIGRVAVGDPKTVGVNVLNTRAALLTGKKRGDTSLLIWPKGVDKPIHYSVVVGSGDLPAVLLNAKRQDLKTQVQTHIRIAEVSRSAIRRIGFNFLRNPNTGPTIGVSPPGRSAGISSGGAGGGNGGSSFGGPLSLQSNSGFQPIGDAFNLVFSSKNKNTAGLLSILERRGLMHTLAEPTLVAMSGQTATFLAGGEFPIPVVQGGNSGSITVEFKQFGIRLSLTPTVLSEKRIELKVAPEVSSLNFDAGVTVQGTQVPGISVRRTDTTVELGDDETFIISGLVDQNLSATVDKVPGLGDLPILGAFFRSTNFKRNDRELIMVVTPHLVTPLAKGTEVKLPGAKYETYNPSSTNLFLFEKGDFDQQGDSPTGFSR